LIEKWWCLFFWKSENDSGFEAIFEVEIRIMFGIGL